ncbi:hypothetical protein TNCV_1389701 [Trichonephila clavipes]|nr:hypothetical protein TNCV_1389701 [Trichonephila clavipes]
MERHSSWKCCDMKCVSVTIIFTEKGYGFLKTFPPKVQVIVEVIEDPRSRNGRCALSIEAQCPLVDVACQPGEGGTSPGSSSSLARGSKLRCPSLLALILHYSATV